MKAWEKVNIRMAQLEGGPNYECMDENFQTLGPILLREGDIPVLIWMYEKIRGRYRYCEFDFPTLKEMKKKKMYEDPRLSDKERYDDPDCLLRFMGWIRLGDFPMVPWLTTNDLCLICQDFATGFAFYRDDDDPIQIEVRKWEGVTTGKTRVFAL